MENTKIKIEEVIGNSIISSKVFDNDKTKIDTIKGEIELDVEKMNEIINLIIEEHPDKKGGMYDYKLSKSIYEMLDINPRVAAERKNFWISLCVKYFPQWIPYRWGSYSPERWGKRPERNAFASLWWMAKILSDIWDEGEEDFSIYAYKSANIFLYIIDTMFLKSPVILKNYLIFAKNILSKGWNGENVNDKTFQKYTSYLNKRLSNLAYEGMSSTEVHDLLRECFYEFNKEYKSKIKDDK